MSLLELSGIAVVSGTLTLPRAGRWVANLELEDTPPRDGARVELRGPGLVLSGHIARVGTFHGAHRVRVCGGTGGLPQPVTAQSFRSMPVGLLLDDVLGAVNERRAIGIDAAILDRVLPAWVRPAGPAAEALASLCDILGVTWRALADGTIWIGIDEWRASPATGELLDADPVSRTIHAALDDMRLMPGTTWQGCKVDAVTHHIDGTGFRTDVATLRPGAPKEGVRDAVRTAVLQITKHHDYQALRAARVIAQNDDYTLELKPEDEAWPGMSKVPIRTGIPGCRFRVSKGARVLFTFEDGDATRPIVVDWDAAAVEKLIFKAGIVDLRDEKGRAIACNGDMVMIPTSKGIPVQFFLGDPVTGLPIGPYITPLQGAPFPPGVLILGSAAAGFTIAGQVVAVSPNRS